MKSLSPLVFALFASSAAAAPCGGGFAQFVTAMKRDAAAAGYGPAITDTFFQGVRQDPAVLRADRAQGVFKMGFTDFARRVISANRMQNGQRNAARYADIFDRVERDYGVPRGILLAFWALETDYGQVQGDFNTLNALMTLSHDCRRPDLFQPQVLAALELFARGDFDKATTGAWAGEIGMVQMLPQDILINGVDGDGDGHVSLKTSPPDALLSGAKMLRHLGWHPNQPWLQEVTVPDQMDWSKTGLRAEQPPRDWAAMGVRPRSGDWQGAGLPASLILPEGRKGPAFLAYPNYRVLFEWNQSYVYVTTAAYFATRLSGAPVFDAGTPEPGLSDAQMKQLQTRLQAMGHDVGKIDGILGARTREAVQKVQQQLGLPADAWPTPALLNRL
ncbi:lytic murein transglycosylase [Aliiroseovarius sp. PTFE2010]|uniref:lytic murein transglycosylase n=1 Tax=Aliiroseovarius sp. PTFE2010 TaxID=3417190 RepID=UPI003CF55EFB